MKKEIVYITIDGRGEHETFRDCVTKALADLKPGEGIHVIKDFEPFPLYKMMEVKGFDKFIEKHSEEEFHVYFFPVSKIDGLKMNQYLTIDRERIQKMTDIKLEFLHGRISLAEARVKMKASFDQVTAEEFAAAEQLLQAYGVTDDTLAERMEEILELFEGILVSTEWELPPGHPIHTYREEVAAIRKVLADMKSLLAKKFIKNLWLDLYERLSQIHIHFSRKQNQLFAALEKKGFDRPSKVMWTLDNQIRDGIRKSKTLLQEDQDEAFFARQPEVIQMVEDMMVKETEILFPTAVELLTEEDFAAMRIGDDEIGYCLIENPPAFPEPKTEVQKAAAASGDLLHDLLQVLAKHGVTAKKKEEEELNVSQGLLTLQQINLIFKHLPVDLSFVDENELVKFYSDTKHRVFPRSAGVIGRAVQNCHPRESVDTVEKIIRAFRRGEQNEAEFWLEMGGKFIYILYTAVRDEEGNFRGVLEMMQDATHIRSLTGSQRLLSWDTPDQAAQVQESPASNPYAITKDTNIASLLKEYPYLKDFLIHLSPKFEKLNSPMFKTMAGIANLQMVSARGGFESSDLIAKLVEEIDRNQKK